MKYLGLDYGTKRVGLAVSDPGGSFAFPKMTLPNDKMLIGDLKAFIKKEGVEALVVGESRNFAGVDNPVMRDVRWFVAELARDTGLPVYLEPEWYSTAEARMLAGRDGAVDAEAAAIILKSYLDRTKTA